jgi:phosphatidylinositol-3-phosphatase
MRFRCFVAASPLAALLVFGPAAAQQAAPRADGVQASTTSAVKQIFVIVMENHDAAQIYGNTQDAPYINGTLMKQYAYATNFGDELPALESEPHYIWMEAGTNAFADHKFTTDNPPSKKNSTADTEHLVTQIKNATTGLSWRSYQEGIGNGSKTGKCPIARSGHYDPKHDPFVFFRDVAGSPPSKTNAYCGSHHADLGQLSADLANQSVATFNFITPDLCHDMHGDSGCPRGSPVAAGDSWLSANLPPIISYANAHQGAIFLVWDEGDRTNLMPLLAIGPHTKVGYAGAVRYDHSSLLKSLERILELAVLPKVSAANDLADLFEPGFFP